MVLVEGEEQVFEASEALNPEDDLHPPQFFKDVEKGDTVMKANDDQNDASGEMQEETNSEEEAARERALEEWNTFREEHLESTFDRRRKHSAIGVHANRLHSMLQLWNNYHFLCTARWLFFASWMTTAKVWDRFAQIRSEY